MNLIKFSIFIFITLFTFLFNNNSNAEQTFNGMPIPGSNVEAMEGTPGSGNFFISETTPDGIIHQVIEQMDPNSGDVFFQEVYVDNSRQKVMPNMPNWGNIAFKQTINDPENPLTSNNNFSMSAVIDDFEKRIALTQHIQDKMNGLTNADFSMIPEYDINNNFNGYKMNNDQLIEDSNSGLKYNYELEKYLNEKGEPVSLQVNFNAVIDNNDYTNLEGNYVPDFEFNRFSEFQSELDKDLNNLLEETIADYETNIMDSIVLEP